MMSIEFSSGTSQRVTKPIIVGKHSCDYMQEFNLMPSGVNLGRENNLVNVYF